MSPRRYLLPSLATAAVLLLAGCAPAATSPSEPVVAVLNGPQQGRIAGSASLLESAMEQQGPLGFTFVNDLAMRFSEGHNDLFYDRAAPAAARIARSYGAPYAVLVGASQLDRQVTVSKDGSARTVEVTLRVQAVVVDAATAHTLATFDSSLLQQSRRESTADPLPALQRDPTVEALRNEGVRNVAPAVVGSLWHALSLHPGPAAP